MPLRGPQEPTWQLCWVVTFTAAHDFDSTYDNMVDPTGETRGVHKGRVVRHGLRIKDNEVGNLAFRQHAAIQAKAFGGPARHLPHGVLQSE